MTYIQNPLSFQVPANAGTKTKRQLEIISKASKLISKKGANGLTIKNLAKEMCFSEAALYRHFASKEKIVVAMIDHLTFQMDEIFNSIDKELEPDKRYKEYFNLLLEFFLENKTSAKVAFSVGMFDETEKTTEALNGINNLMQKHLIPIVMDGKLKGDFPMALNADRIVHMLLGSFRLNMQKWAASQYKFDVVKTGNDIMNAMLPLFKK